jgi:hypothetical protein
MNELPKLSSLPERQAYTVAEFCDAHGFSIARYYALRREGLGPAEMRFGNTVRISIEAAAAWRQERENPIASEALQIDADRQRLRERSLRAARARR